MTDISKPTPERKWDDQFISKCISDAKSAMPDVVEAVAKHDTGKDVLTDEEFEPLIETLQNFVFKYTSYESSYDILKLFSQVRREIKNRIHQV